MKGWTQEINGFMKVWERESTISSPFRRPWAVLANPSFSSKSQDRVLAKFDNAHEADVVAAVSVLVSRVA
jgi:hypothetical protein